MRGSDLISVISWCRNFNMSVCTREIAWMHSQGNLWGDKFYLKYYKWKRQVGWVPSIHHFWAAGAVLTFNYMHCARLTIYLRIIFMRWAARTYVCSKILIHRFRERHKSEWKTHFASQQFETFRMQAISPPQLKISFPLRINNAHLHIAQIKSILYSALYTLQYKNFNYKH